MKKNGGPAAQALGRSRGGFSTKIHAGCINDTTGVTLILTGGECSDMPGCDRVFAALPEGHVLEHGIMDKGYDRNAIRAKLNEHHINPVIPPKKNRKESIAYDQALYKLREKVERFFNRLRQFRRIATRYDKLGNTYLGRVVTELRLNFPDVPYKQYLDNLRRKRLTERSRNNQPSCSPWGLFRLEL